jgi:hypothetical protein
VGLAADGTQLVSALGFADGELKDAREPKLELGADEGKLRPAARSAFTALYVAGGPRRAC